MELIEDVANYLAAQGQGVVGTDIFMNDLPSSPVVAIGIYNTGGPESEMVDPVHRDGFQLLMRGEQHSIQLPKARTVYNLLHDKWNILTERKGRIVGELRPGSYYLDDANFVVYTLNFVLIQTIGGS